MSERRRSVRLHVQTEPAYLASTPALLGPVSQTWYVIDRKQTGETRVDIPSPVVTELERYNSGPVFRYYSGEVDANERIRREINDAAQRAAQRYPAVRRYSAEEAITWLRAHQGEDLALAEWQYALLELALRGDQLPRQVHLNSDTAQEPRPELFDLYAGRDPADAATPDTSQPYFLDLIRRIDDVTERP